MHDPMELEAIESEPRYTLTEAGRLTGTSPQNIRRWLFGYAAPGHRMQPVLGSRESQSRPLVSFLDLCELAVVAGFRSAQQPVTLERLRRAHRFAAKVLEIGHPFASERIREEGGHLMYDFTSHDRGPGTLVLDMYGQMVLPAEVMRVLERFEFDDGPLARRWFPFGRDVPVVVDPARGGGMPVIAGRNLRSDMVLGRWKAGESIADLADDYELEPRVIEAALRSAA